MKTRLDVALVERGLIQSRERAKAVIMSGIVYVNNQKADKPGQDVSETDQIEVRGESEVCKQCSLLQKYSHFKKTTLRLWMEEREKET